MDEHFDYTPSQSAFDLHPIWETILPTFDGIKDDITILPSAKICRHDIARNPWK